jgi:predicted CXXCH cytochrome family protein
MYKTLRFYAFLGLLISLFSFGCSKQNPALDVKNSLTGGQQENLATYPHPVSWRNQHIDVMATNKIALGETVCLQCHNGEPAAPSRGKPLNISCAMQCHQTTVQNLPPKTVPTPVVNKCTTCHAAVTDNKFGHYPSNAGLCTTCHAVSAGHLAGDKTPTQTKMSANDCYRCHTRKDSETNVHPALLDENSCITCHNPHGGTQRFFLQDLSKDKTTNVKAMCTQCHSFDVEGMATKHGAVESPRSCLNCHNPHSSKNEKLLRLPSKDMCLSCHDKPIQATISEARIIPNIKAKMEAASQHSGAMGNCTDCHNPHGSQNSRILIENNSIENYNQYPPVAGAANPYALCMTCHVDFAAKLTAGDMTTGFRSTTTNYHFKHVVTESKSCKICHDPHGSSQDFHINESWNMNGTPIDIKYTKTANGGSCTTCHELKTYSRE